MSLDAAGDLDRAVNRPSDGGGAGAWEPPAVDVRLPLLAEAKRNLVRYAAAAGIVAVAVVVRIALDRWLQLDAPFMLFLAAIVGAAWYGGLGPGLLATFLSAGACAFFFLDPHHDIRLATAADAMQLGLFVAEALITCALCASLHAATRRAEAEAARSRALEGTVLEISDAEQRRIGHDLHDGLGQHLTGVAFLAKAMADRLTTVAPGEAAAAGRVAKLLNEAIRRTRDVARGLSPVSAESLSLESALRGFADTTSEMFGIRCNLEWDPGVSVEDPSAALHLFRIAQEAVNNAVRHGKAKQVTIATEATPGDGMVLTITDDGIGIRPDAVHGGRGMGMEVMRFRARRIGGTLAVRRLAEENPGRAGTVVRCEVSKDVSSSSGSGSSRSERKP